MTCFAPSHWRPLVAVLMAALLAAGLPLAQAQVTVPDNTDLSTVVDPNTSSASTAGNPALGSVWNLTGTDYSLSSTITLLAGTLSLTINGASGGSLITLGSGSSIQGVNSTLSLSNVTISGANRKFTAASRGGGAYGDSVEAIGSLLTLNTSGVVIFQNNSAAGVSGSSVGGGAAIGSYANSIIVNGNLIATGNSMNGPCSFCVGGAIGTTGGTLTINGDLTANDNTVMGNSYARGAVYAQGALTITGSFTANGNTATTTASTLNGSITVYGGAVTAMGAPSNGLSLPGGGLNLAATSGSNVTLTGNIASSDGGAAFARYDISIGNSAGTIDLENNFAGYNLTDATQPASPGNVTLATTVANGGAVSGGTYSTATLAPGPGVVTLTGSAITLKNNQATGSGGGVYSGGTVTLTGALTASGNLAANGNGGAIGGGGDVTLNAVNGPGMIFSGNTQNAAGTAQANAIYLNNTNGASTPAVLTLNAAGYPITFYDPIQSNAANGLISVRVEDAGGDTVAFDGSQYTAAADQWSQVYGSTEVQSGVLAVQNNAVYGVLAADVTESATTSLTVDAGATLAGGGSTTPVGTVRADTFTLAGTLNIAGSATPIGSATGGFSTFNVVSGGETLTGGTVVFNTCLNDAATSQSDVLVLDANNATSATSGTARIQVRNVGGAGCAGALTSGDGILLVNAIDGATTQTTAFQLAATVAAGGYGYALVQGGADGSAQKAQNWYLRSSLLPVPVAVPALGRAAIVALLALLIGAASMWRRQMRRGGRSFR